MEIRYYLYTNWGHVCLILQNGKKKSDRQLDTTAPHLFREWKVWDSKYSYEFQCFFISFLALALHLCSFVIYFFLFRSFRNHEGARIEIT